MSIVANILNDDEMRKIGFTDFVKDTWNYMKILDRKMGISFSVRIKKENPDNLKINVLDEYYLQPYDYQYILESSPDFLPALKIKKCVENEMNYLRNSGVLSGNDDMDEFEDELTKRCKMNGIPNEEISEWMKQI